MPVGAAEAVQRNDRGDRLIARVYLDATYRHAVHAGEVFFREHRRGRAIQMHGIVQHQQRLVGDAERVIGMMGGQEHREFAATRETLYQSQHDPLIGQIERRGGLVKDQDPAVAGKRTRQQDELTLSSAQAVVALVRDGGEPDLMQAFQRPGLVLASR